MKAARARTRFAAPLFALAFALLAIFARAEIPPTGTQGTLSWKPSAQPGVSLARITKGGNDVPVSTRELEEHLTKKRGESDGAWLQLRSPERAGRRYDSILRHYFPDSKTAAFPAPFEERVLAREDGTSFTLTQDELAPPYVRISSGTGAREWSLSRSFVDDTLANAAKSDAKRAAEFADSAYVLPESLRAKFNELSRQDFRAALITATELDSAEFMQIHRAYVALATSRGPDVAIYPTGPPILPAARDINPPKPPQKIIHTAQPSPTSKKGYIGAAIAAALIILVLIGSVLRH